MITSALLELSCCAVPLAAPLLAARRLPAGADSGGQLLIWLLLAGAAIAVVCGGGYFGHRWHHHYRHQTHAALFQGLCDSQGLDRASRRLLAQVGRCHRLGQPARLFTEPQWLDPANLDGRFQTRAEEILALRTRIFSLTALKSNG
ncbi:MAG: hypothetical protein HUU20_01365 [Pirellulales bacterium]|nr:hypothetical protein [Pirellulales bacterium]